MIYGTNLDPSDLNSPSIDGNRRATILGVISRIVVWEAERYLDEPLKLSLTGCGNPNLPTWTARVDAVVPWIKKQITLVDRDELN